MKLVFIPVMVALTGLFGLAFALYGVPTIKKQRGGCGGKQQPKEPSRGPSSGSQKTFHRCTTPGCKISLPGQDPHGQCFTCLTLDHDMNNCGPCLTSPADTQQCRAIRLYVIRYGFAVSGDWFTPDSDRSVSWVGFTDFRAGQGVDTSTSSCCPSLL